MVEALDDHSLLAASRCHGWAVLDVVVHVRAGLEEMLRGVTAPTDADPTVDAASYWSTWPAAGDSEAALDGVLWTRRTASAYRRPTSAVRHLRDAADAIMAAAQRMTDCALAFQGQVLASGDFLATWAVELAVHHLDLARDLDVGAPVSDALLLTRETVAALLGAPVPNDVSDLDAALICSGRAPVPPDQPGLRSVFG